MDSVKREMKSQMKDMKDMMEGKLAQIDGKLEQVLKKIKTLHSGGVSDWKIQYSQWLQCGTPDATISGNLVYGRLDWIVWHVSDTPATIRWELSTGLV